MNSFGNSLSSLGFSIGYMIIEVIMRRRMHNDEVGDRHCCSFAFESLCVEVLVPRWWYTSGNEVCKEKLGTDDTEGYVRTVTISVLAVCFLLAVTM